jgi:hypothetical protein
MKSREDRAASLKGICWPEELEWFKQAKDGDPIPRFVSTGVVALAHLNHPRAEAEIKARREMAESPCLRCYYSLACSQGDAGRCDSAPEGQYPHFRDRSLGPNWVHPSKSPMSTKCRIATGSEMPWLSGRIVHKSRNGTLWILVDDVIMSSKEFVAIEVEE